MPTSTPPRWKTYAALVAVYLIWGSTYLGIRFAIETLPPFLMAAGRFLVAGSLIYGWTIHTSPDRPTRAHWRSAVIIGGLMLLGGNGMVTWSEQHISSGLAALIISGTPLWIVVFNWLFFGSSRPNRRMAFGLALGLVGIAVLIGPADLVGGSDVNPLGVAGVMLAEICWATGSLYSRRAAMPASPMLATGMEMLAGGVLLTVVGTLAGDWARFDPGAVSLRSAGAWVYLAIFGSLISFSAYIWLLHNTTPARAASYAYVNPVVAVFLGWALAGEELSVRMIVAAAIIISSVMLITSVGAQQEQRPHREPASVPPLPAAEVQDEPARP